MKSFILTTTLIVTLLCLFSSPTSTFGLPKKLSPKPLDSVFSNIPEIPNIPKIPDIPRLPNIPEIPNIPELPNISSEIPNILNIPNILGLPNILGIPSIPRIPSIPDLPSIANIPQHPNIPGLPALPGFPGQSPPPLYRSIVSLKSAEMEKWLTKDESKTAEKCFSKLLPRWAGKDIALDKECCVILVKINKKRKHFGMSFKNLVVSTSLVQYACHI